MGADVACWKCGGMDRCECDGEIVDVAIEQEHRIEELEAEVDRLRQAIVDIIEMSARDEYGVPGDIEATARKALK